MRRIKTVRADVVIAGVVLILCALAFFLAPTTGSAVIDTGEGGAAMTAEANGPALVDTSRVVPFAILTVLAVLYIIGMARIQRFRKSSGAPPGRQRHDFTSGSGDGDGGGTGGWLTAARARLTTVLARGGGTSNKGGWRRRREFPDFAYPDAGTGGRLSTTGGGASRRRPRTMMNHLLRSLRTSLGLLAEPVIGTGAGNNKYVLPAS